LEKGGYRHGSDVPLWRRRFPLCFLQGSLQSGRVGRHIVRLQQRSEQIIAPWARSAVGVAKYLFQRPWPSIICSSKAAQGFAGVSQRLVELLADGEGQSAIFGEVCLAKELSGFGLQVAESVELLLLDLELGSRIRQVGALAEDSTDEMASFSGIICL
jgi:hypothetical protein